VEGPECMRRVGWRGQSARIGGEVQRLAAAARARAAALSTPPAPDTPHTPHNTCACQVKLIDFGAACDLCTGINFNPEYGMLDPRYSGQCIPLRGGWPLNDRMDRLGAWLGVQGEAGVRHVGPAILVALPAPPLLALPAPPPHPLLLHLAAAPCRSRGTRHAQQRPPACPPLITPPITLPNQPAPHSSYPTPSHSSRGGGDAQHLPPPALRSSYGCHLF
jgi:hypothetical protein